MQQCISKLTSWLTAANLMRASYLDTDLVELTWVVGTEIRSCHHFVEKLLLLESGSVDQRDPVLCKRRNQLLPFRLIFMKRWLPRVDSWHVSFLLFISHFTIYILILLLPLPVSCCLRSHCILLSLQLYFFMLLYFSPHLQSTVSGSLPSTWLCDGVCIGWQSCCFVSRGVWWLSVCQTKRESHRCSWLRQQAAPSSWSCSHSKIIWSNREEHRQMNHCFVVTLCFQCRVFPHGKGKLFLQM